MYSPPRPAAVATLISMSAAAALSLMLTAATPLPVLEAAAPSYMNASRG